MFNFKQKLYRSSVSSAHIKTSFKTFLNVDKNSFNKRFQLNTQKAYILNGKKLQLLEKALRCF